MNSDEAEARVRAGVANGDDDTEALCALPDFYEQNVAIIHDQRRKRDDLQEQLDLSAAEVERLRAEQKLDGAEIERLQKVVADHALTIGTLKDELGATTEALAHERDCSTGLADELVRSEKEAATARLALDVATKEVEAQKTSKDRAYRERNMLVAALSKLFDSHLCMHDENDATWERDWMTIVCIHGPCGQMTWHLHDSDVPLFSHLLYEQNHWDGHSTDEKYTRLEGLSDVDV